jgi:hypothetical protein
MKGEKMLISPKQLAFAGRLANERGVALDSSFSTWSMNQASEEIARLLAMPKVGVRVLPEGIYLKDGIVYKVQVSGAGRSYAKVLREKGGFEYDNTAIKNLSIEDKITIEQAKAYGVQYGVCVVCGALLTDAKSVAAGIGPVCGKRI